MFRALSLLMLAAWLAAIPSRGAAQEVYGGVLAHGVNTPFTIDVGERGVDLQAGVRFDEVDSLGGGQPHVFGSVNLSGDTSFVGAGVTWKAEIGPIYLRPGIGLIVHDGPERRIRYNPLMRTDLGSRVLFAPELGIGYDIDERWSVEATWVHMSHARVFDSEQNPGIDMMGVRVNFRL